MRGRCQPKPGINRHAVPHPHAAGPQGPVLPSVPPVRLSGLVMPVLFFRRCFLRLAWGDGGGSSLGLVAPAAPPPALAPGPPAVASTVPLAERRQTKEHA